MAIPTAIVDTIDGRISKLCNENYMHFKEILFR